MPPDLFVFISFFLFSFFFFLFSFFSLLFLHPVRERRRFYLKTNGIRSLQLLTLNLNQIEANKGQEREWVKGK